MSNFAGWLDGQRRSEFHSYPPVLAANNEVDAFGFIVFLAGIRKESVSLPSVGLVSVAQVIVLWDEWFEQGFERHKFGKG